MSRVHYDHKRRQSDHLEKYDMKIELEGMTNLLSFVSNKSVKEAVALMPSKLDKLSWTKGFMKVARNSFASEPTNEKTKSRRRNLTNILGLNSSSIYIPMMLDHTEKILEKIKSMNT